MPLGTMILPTLITPKSSFPSLSFSFSVSLPFSLSHLPNYNMQRHNSAHMLTYTPYAEACAAHRNTPELTAGPVICDEAWLGRRREFGWFSICLHPSFIPLHIFPWGMNDFHITTFEADYFHSHAVIRGVLERNFLEWRNGVMQFLKDRSFLFLTCTVTDGRERDRCENAGKRERERDRQRWRKNKKSQIHINAGIWASGH